MKVIIPASPDTQVLTAQNHNRRRYYRIGVSQRPDGRKFTWDDWTREFDLAKESQVQTPSTGWKIVTLAVYDCGVDSEFHPTGWVEVDDISTAPRLYDGSLLAAAEGLVEIETEN